MRQTKIILMEGLPSTGKSTNSGFLLDQLEKNGRRSSHSQFKAV
jgi:thymidylate kinase